MKYLTYITLFFLVTLAAVSCTERIEIELDESYARLVVDGSITTDTMAHVVMLSSTSSYFYNEPTPRITGAVVTISDGIDTILLTEDTIRGIYRTPDNVYGIPGHTYTLSVKLASPVGGYTDYSASSTLYGVNQLDSISLLFHPEWSNDGFWEVKIYVQEPPTIDFYRFLIYRNDQKLTDTIDEWFVTDDKFFNGSYTNGASVAFLEQGSSSEGLNPGDKVTVEVNSIGKQYANFLWEAQAEIRGSNPLFSGPPANVQGNISNGGVGYFAAYSATRSFTLTPEIE